MKPSPLYASFLVSIAAALLLLSAARADPSGSATTAQFKFSDPAKPGTLKVMIGRGSIRVRGADQPGITVVSDSTPPENTPRKDGLRVLTAASSYSLVEKDNVATLSYGYRELGEGRGNFEITVPRATNVVIKSAWGGETTCSDLTGDIEVKCLNGAVRLDNVRGGALVESTNGAIRASILELHPGRPVSFTSMNGPVTIRVPAAAQANVRLRTQNGKILTDFDDKALVTKTEQAPRGPDSGGDASDGILNEQARQAIRQAARETAQAAREAAQAVREGAGDGSAPVPPAPPAPALPPLPPMTGGKIVAGTLNGGGPEIQAATLNGDLTLRKIDPAKQQEIK